MAKLNYQAVNKIDNINGKVIDAGEVVSLEDKVAAPLVKSGALLETEAAPSPPPAPAAK